MDSISRLGGAVAVLALSGCVSIEPAEPAMAHRSDTDVVEVPGPAGGAVPDEASTAVARSAVEPGEPTGRAAAAPVQGAPDAAGDQRAVRERRLTVRQKRIFVLGLAAQEKK